MWTNLDPRRLKDSELNGSWTFQSDPCWCKQIVLLLKQSRGLDLLSWQFLLAQWKMTNCGKLFSAVESKNRGRLKVIHSVDQVSLALCGRTVQMCQSCVISIHVSTSVKHACKQEQGSKKNKNKNRKTP
jgi:hypothetical protein